MSTGESKLNPLTQAVNTFASIPILEFKIIKFLNKTHCEKKYRPWLVFRPKTGVLNILQTITTKPYYIAEIYYDDEESANSVVTIAENEFNPPLSRFSYIDCNIKDSLNAKTNHELAEEIDWEIGVEKCPEIMPDNIVKRIVTAIINSPHTGQEIKNSLSKKYTNLLRNSS